MRQLNYGPGSIIVYRANGGEIRKVVVTCREEDVKNGVAGFEGHLLGNPESWCWGYDDQITSVEKV